MRLRNSTKKWSRRFAGGHGMHLLTQLIAKEEVLDENAPEDDLMQLEGMTEATGLTGWPKKDIRSQEDLAELAVDELVEINEMSDEDGGRADHGGARPLVCRRRVTGNPGIP